MRAMASRDMYRAIPATAAIETAKSSTRSDGEGPTSSPSAAPCACAGGAAAAAAAAASSNRDSAGARRAAAALPARARHRIKPASTGPRSAA